MKKKLIAIAIAGVVAAPLTAQASSHGAQPQVTFGGDANFVMTNKADSHWAGENRVRLTIAAKANEKVTAHARIRMQEGWTSPVTGKVVDNDLGYSTSPMSAQGVRTDYAYIQMNAGPVSILAGDQLATFGTGIFIQGANPKNRLKVVYKEGPLKAAVMLDPYYKSDTAPTAAGFPDATGEPNIKIMAQYKMSNMMTAGILYGTEQDAKQALLGGKKDAWNDIFVKVNMSGVHAALERKSDVMTVKDVEDAKTKPSGSMYINVGADVSGIALDLHYTDASKIDDDVSPIGAIQGDAAVFGGTKGLTLLTASMAAGPGTVTIGVGTDNASNNAEGVTGLDYATEVGGADFNFSYGAYKDGSGKDDSAFGFSFATKF